MPHATASAELDVTPVRRAKPLLGTTVSIQVVGLAPAAAHALIDRGFAAVDRIHGLMSFHEPQSDLSRLNAAPAGTDVPVSPETWQVLQTALVFSLETDGVFDVTVAPRLVDWGFLPPPEGPAGKARAPDPAASWRDIVLRPNHCIRLERPLWLDLGGIAKGFAVDCAIEAMAGHEGVSMCVNAGGDLRVAGPQAERVLLRAPVTEGMVPVVTLEDGSLASSSGREHGRTAHGLRVGPHVDAKSGGPMDTAAFVSVVAPRCMVADVLTKIVLAQGAGAAATLHRHDAIAYHYTEAGGWRTVGASEPR